MLDVLATIFLSEVILRTCAFYELEVASFLKDDNRVLLLQLMTIALLIFACRLHKGVDILLLAIYDAFFRENKGVTALYVFFIVFRECAKYGSDIREKRGRRTNMKRLVDSEGFAKWLVENVDNIFLKNNGEFEDEGESENESENENEREGEREHN